MSLKLDFDHKTTLSLESQLEHLALESEVVANVIETFKSVIPSLTSKLTTIFSSFAPEETYASEVKDVKKLYDEVKVKIPHAKFVNYSKTLISVPEGFKGNLIDYTTVLLSISNDVFQEANSVLSQYNAILSSFITNKEDKISLKDHTEFFSKLTKKREALNEQMTAFFPERSALSKTYLSDVLSRFGDVEELVALTEKLSDSRKKHSIKDIATGVKKSTDLLDIIVHDVQTKGMNSISGNAAMNISEGAYELGKYVEFISIYCYRTEQLVTTVLKLMETIERVI